MKRSAYAIAWSWWFCFVVQIPQNQLSRMDILLDISYNHGDTGVKVSALFLLVEPLGNHLIGRTPWLSSDVIRSLVVTVLLARGNFYHRWRHFIKKNDVWNIYRYFCMIEISDPNRMTSEWQAETSPRQVGHLYSVAVVSCILVADVLVVLCLHPDAVQQHISLQWGSFKSNREGKAKTLYTHTF